MCTEVEESINFEARSQHILLRMDLNQSEDFNPKRLKFGIFL